MVYTNNFLWVHILLLGGRQVGKLPYTYCFILWPKEEDSSILNLVLSETIKVTFEVVDEFDNNPIVNAHITLWPLGYSRYDSPYAATHKQGNIYEASLPAGTYYYMVEVNDKSVIHGPVDLERHIYEDCNRYRRKTGILHWSSLFVFNVMSGRNPDMLQSI